jgi:hypothetical protein
MSLSAKPTVTIGLNNRCNIMERIMSRYIYVDNSNVFIEGKRVSAVDKGLSMDIFEATKNKILDNEYRIDFGKLHTFLLNGDSSGIKKAVLFGSRPPANDSLWSMAKKGGFDPKIEDRNIANQEKRIDTGITSAMMRDSYTLVDKEKDLIVLVAGDGDYIPPVETLVNDGYKVEVVFWDHASAGLKSACSKFRSLDSHLKNLQRS